MALFVFYLPGQVTADFFDAVRDFSTTRNPNGRWSYGFTSTLGGTFSPYTISGDLGNHPSLPGWGFTSPATGAIGEPWVVKNVSGATAVFNTLNLEPAKLAFHPGPQGRYSVVRWTAPSDGSYGIDATFEA